MRVEEALQQLHAAAEMLRTEHPEIVTDDELWLSSLESITDAVDLADALTERALHLAALEAAAKERAAQIQARAKRFAVEQDRIRDLLLAIVDAAGGRKMVRPGFTLSPRNTPPKVIATEPGATPMQYMREVKEMVPDKKAIAEALELGAPVEGWHRTNGGRSLSILVR